MSMVTHEPVINKESHMIADFTWQIRKHYDDWSRSQTTLLVMKNSSGTIWYNWYMSAEKVNKYLGVFIHLENATESDVRAKFSTHTPADKRFMADKEYNITKFGAPHLLLHIDKYAEMNSLSVICKITVVDSLKTQASRSLSLTPVAQKFSMAGLLEEMQFSDVLLVCRDKQVRAHKLILSARSSVFSAMFRHDFKENTNNRVNLENYDSEVIHQLLRYMYTNTVDDLESFANELLPLANKYDLPELKQLSFVSLHPKIEVANAVEVLLLADMYHVDNFKAAATRFIKENYTAVEETEQWEQLRKHPHLVVDIFCRK